MLEWAMKQGDGVLFLPDKHLACNTANALSIPEESRIILTKDVIDGDPSLSIDVATTDTKQFIIWPGYCPVHEEFSLDTIKQIRKNQPDAKIIVHPECDPAVVQASDGNGSTTYLINYAAQAPAGSTLFIGTEQNLVHRLAKQYKSEKTIEPLKTSLCEDMGKITVANLASLLENIETATPVDVAEDVREPAKLALERMLEICS